MKKNLLRLCPFSFFLILTLVFFYPLFQGKLPFPGDTLIGGYLPWRNISWGGMDRYPVKNMTITDAANSFYPWRFEAIRQIKDGKIPLWNRFEFGGNPLLANPSTAVFYPLNFIFFILSFNWAWTFQIIFQPLLTGFFLFLFLRNKGLSTFAAIFGSVCFSWGSYFLTVTEFNVLGNTALWLPLILLAVDKIFEKNKKWFFGLVFSLIMTILAGFFQFVFYEFLLAIGYSLFLFSKNTYRKGIIWVFAAIVISLLACSFQILPFLELVRASSRIGGYGNLEVITNFFVPFRQLIMFIVPDFFGNPGTGNYWGAINYYEFCGYIGISALLFVFYSLLSKKQTRETFFWLVVFLVSVLLVVKNPISLLPYNFRLPFLSSLIPARLLLVSTFSLSILTAFGVQKFLKDIETRNNKKNLLYLLPPVVCLSGVLFFLGYVGLKPLSFGIESDKALIILRNLALPTIIFGLSIIFSLLAILKPSKSKILLFSIILITIFDLQRQGNKFLPFIDQKLIYPETGVTKFLKENLGNYRFLNTHQEIFGTNYQTVYGLESTEGYNPLHKYDYSIFISMGESGGTVDTVGTKFERTVYGRNYKANIYNLLSVKYFLSLDNVISKDYPLVFQENEVKVYENKKVLPRVFLSCNPVISNDPKEIINQIILAENPAEKVFIDKNINVLCGTGDNSGKVKIINYSSENIKINAITPQSKILTLNNGYFPGWKVLIDGKQTELLKIDYVLMGVIVPAGNHTVSFIYDPESFKIGVKVSLSAFLVLMGFAIYEIKISRTTRKNSSKILS